MDGRSDLTRTTLAVLFVAGLIAACFWILRPFLPAIIWATTLVVATWPVMLRVQHRLWNRRGLAVAIMTLALLLVFVVPFWLAITTIVDNFDRIVEWGTSLNSFKLPGPPEWLAAVPLFGERAVQLWESVAASGVEPLVAKAAPYAGDAASWFVAALGGLGITFVQFLLTVVIAAIMYIGGERVAAVARRFGYRLAGERGEQSVRLAGQAIRSVKSGWGTFALVWTIVVGSLDSILRPILISKGAHLPLVLLLAGVIGGIIAFGLVGIFLGPVVLAVGYTLLQSWLAEDTIPHNEVATRLRR